MVSGQDLRSVHMNTKSTRGFTIGSLAEQAGVSIDTIRYYERMGLLPAPQRRASGYREYDASALERVRFIRRAKDLTFSLAEVCDLLNLSADGEHGVQGVRQRASERLAEINRLIHNMEAVRDHLSRLIEACPGHGLPDCCPILSDLRGSESGEASPSSYSNAADAAHPGIRSCCADSPRLERNKA